MNNNCEWRSCAQWPTDGDIELQDTNNVSTDDHGALDQALAVCRMLRNDGFGGCRKEFPVATWVEKWNKETKTWEEVDGSRQTLSRRPST